MRSVFGLRHRLHTGATSYAPSRHLAEGERGPPTARVVGIVDEVCELTLLELADLSAVLMTELGIGPDELPVVGMMSPGGMPLAQQGGPGAGPGRAEEKAEKTAFEVKLESYEAASKIKIIKEVRGLTSLGLKEAKELVEKAPAVIKGGVSKEEAEKIIEKMTAAGAVVVME